MRRVSVFVAATTTVGVQIKVTDTFTGEMRNYANPLGSSLLPIQDTSAFSFCPTPTPTPTLTPTRGPVTTFLPTGTRTPTVSPRSTSTRTLTPSRTQTPTITPTPPPTGTPGPPSPTPTTIPGTAQVSVSCGGIGVPTCHYVPSTVHIHAGDSVMWHLSARFGPHSATASDGSFDSGLGSLFFTHTFPTTGSFPYYCKGMGPHHTGLVIVDP